MNRIAYRRFDSSNTRFLTFENNSKKMKGKILGCVMQLLVLQATAQHKISIADFTGKWKGSLEWSRPGKTPQQFSMQLNIAPTGIANQYTWQINYGDSGKDIRTYSLQPVDTSTGHWAIDEHNGIVLDNYLLSNCLTGSFTVMGNTITDSYCLENGKLKVVFISMKLADKTTTGKRTGDSPSVDSYRLTGMQQGWLEKQQN